MKTLFLGDICPTVVNAHLFRQEDIQTLFTDAVEIFRDRDFTVANLECALTESDKPIRKIGGNQKAPAQTANVLKKLGVDLCALSNNHIMDFGAEGIRDTLRELEKAELQYTGFGENYAASRKNFLLEKDGETICIITVCEHEYCYATEDRMGARPFDEYDTMDDIEAAKKSAHRVIVLFHGGKEYCQYPSPRLRKLCQAMVRHGADLVLCQHSHCVGTYEQYQGGHILYGQGNFHYTEPCPHEVWFTGLAVGYDTRENTVEFMPIRAHEYSIELAKDCDAILESFRRRSEKLHNGEWKQQWHDFCESVRPNYRNAVRKAFVDGASPRDDEMFGHYLDCEAHTDVWRELYATWWHTEPPKE